VEALRCGEEWSEQSVRMHAMKHIDKHIAKHSRLAVREFCWFLLTVAGANELRD
jgi:hypothetical protein